MRGNSVLDVAMECVKAGMSVVPTGPDGSKRSIMTWRRYQREIADAATMRAWWDGTGRGLAVVGGEVSGRLEMVDVDAADGVLLAEELFGSSELAAVWTAAADGWSESSPSGGMHVWWRLEPGAPMPPGIELSWWDRQGVVPPGVESSWRDRRGVVSVRGEGTYAVVAPTPGWGRIAGGPSTVLTIPVDVRDAMIAELVGR